MRPRYLDEARSIWLAEVEKIAAEHDRRTASKFLKPENANGEVADFHALRNTFITMLASSGAHPKVTQEFARHSTITVMSDRYSHTRLIGHNTADENLPSLACPECPMVDAAPDTLSPADFVAVQDRPAVWVARRVALFSGVVCENGATTNEA